MQGLALMTREKWLNFSEMELVALRHALQAGAANQDLPVKLSDETRRSFALCQELLTQVEDEQRRRVT